MNIALDAHRARLARLTSYVASAKAMASLSWKAVKTEHVIVNDLAADPLTDPFRLVVVGQISHGPSYLGPVGNFNAQYDNMGKAKLTFELELPADANFASDYYRAVAALRKLQRDVSKSSDIRNLLVDASPNTNIKFGAPLFRNKLDENDEENLPEGNIADVVDNPDYFPTSTNWPVPGDASRAFNDMMEKHVFDPLHVFTAAGRHIEPTEFARRLPGVLVEVHFTLHHWHFSKDKFDSFNAYPKQIVIIKESAHSDHHRVKKRPGRGIQRSEAIDADKGPSPSRKRKMSDDDGSPTDSTTELIEGMNKATVVGGTDEAEAANIEKLPDVVAVGVKSNRNRPKQILKA